MPGWLEDVLGFYQQFPSIVSESVHEAQASYPHDLPSAPGRLELWKAVGDELIFSCPVTEEHHVHLLVQSFIDAISRWSQRRLNTKKEALPLKGGAWIATFPLPDREIVVIANPGAFNTQEFDPDRVPEHNNRSLLGAIDLGGHAADAWVDYVGPSMDTGFRITSQATPRRFMLSLEVAWLCAVAAATGPDGDKELFLQGEVPMRGVWGGRGYPLFWMDTGHQHAGQPILDELLGTKAAQGAKVIALAQSLCNGQDGWHTKVYLPDSTIPYLKEHHEEIEAEVHRLGQVEDTQGEVPVLPG